MSDSKQILRDGSVNLTGAESSPAAVRNQGPLTLPTGLPRGGKVWLKAWVKGNFTGVSAVNTIHATTTKPTGGTYGVTIGNKTIANTALNFNDTVATVQAAIAALVTDGTWVVNGRHITSFATADLTVSGAALGTGDQVFTAGGQFANQPLPMTLDQTLLTGQVALAMAATATGSQIQIVATDGTNDLDAGTIRIDGAVKPFQEVGIVLDTGNLRLFNGQPETILNYHATVSGGTITVAPVVIELADTLLGMN
jgi:hypothetical protein